MDNNTNNNVSGIPNVSDIKFDDTPAESFDSLYGGSVQQPVNNATMAQGPGMTPNPGVVPGMTQGPSVAPNPGMAPGMTQGPSVAPNPGMAPGMTQGPSMAPNPGMASGMTQGPSMAPNPGMASGMTQGPSMAPNPGMASGMTQGPSMAPNPGMAPGMTQGPSMAPNPGMAPGMTQGASMAPNPGVAQSLVDDLSDIEIDEEKMQSIEEQLSKTSQYNPADFQQEKIVIQTDDQYEKNKSGLTFLIVLFVILILAIFLIPHITKFLK